MANWNVGSLAASVKSGMSGRSWVLNRAGTFATESVRSSTDFELLQADNQMTDRAVRLSCTQRFMWSEGMSESSGSLTRTERTEYPSCLYAVAS